LNEQLKVISTTSSGKYKDSPKLLTDIARELDVNYIPEGSVFQAGNKIRINAALVRVNDDRTVWTKSFDGNVEEVFAYFSSIAIGDHYA
jgi:TolB-like protein